MTARASPITAPRTTLSFAREGDDSSFRRIADLLPPWRIEPAMRLGSSERENALLFAERGIYRPGDTFASKASSAVRRKPETSLVGRKLTPRAHDLYTSAPLDIPGSQSDSGAEATVSM